MNAIIFVRALAVALTGALISVPASGQTAPASAQSAPIVTAIRTQRLIANPALGNGTPAIILVEAGRIKAILPADAPVPAGAKLVDLGSATVLPGLIDSHVHLTGDPGGNFWQEAVESDEHTVAVGVKNALQKNLP